LLIYLSFAISAYYLNGVDWSIYYLKFLLGDEAGQSFEFGFVVYFKILLLLCDNNFGLTVFLFYLISFWFLLNILKNNNSNEALFTFCLLLVFGLTLVLEQLRQLMACIISLFSVLQYNKNNSSKKFILYVLVASSFHVSAIIFIPSMLLTRIKSWRVFTLITMSSVLAIVAALFFGYAFVQYLSGVSTAFQKILFYMDKNPLSINMGWINLFVFLYVVIYLVYGKIIDRNDSLRFLQRMIFIGAVIFVFSGMITFLNRVSFYFIFIALYVVSFSKEDFYRREFAIKNINTLMLNIYLAVFLVLNNASYFRNADAPIVFLNLDTFFFSMMDKDYVNKLAMNKYLDASTSGINNEK